MGGLDNVAMGFATISPSVGLYAVRLGRLGTVANALAVAWLAFETVNIAWPRASLAPAGAPSYQVWPAPLVLAIIGGTGLIYVLVAKPLENLGPRTRTTRASARA